MDKGKGTRAVLLGAKAAGSGVEYSTKGPPDFQALTEENLDSPGQQAAACLSCVDNTTERVALLGGQLCDNTTGERALSV
ncbi:hypothetical protein CTI12_AA607690 [Artemisia annua]|uniref:Uncharacterized protein n=1 Tax=Artemisia annua TaxID=35608 RepID=A0A2U1KFS4_ARTAN|nr:hypothetical protein CTI12_AA607690 [Artemisia annua]